MEGYKECGFCLVRLLVGRLFGVFWYLNDFMIIGSILGSFVGLFLISFGLGSPS